jgi:DNA-binding response OmpR family regulator
MAYKLLLADDSITIQKVVELVLAEEDFEIKSVSNGEDALNLLDAFKPDIVLADIEMPKVNGYNLCDKIKKNPATAHVPVILLAGAFEPIDDELAREVGADDSVIKPFESQELISKLNAVLTMVSAGAGQEFPEEEFLGEDAEDDMFETAEVAEAEEAEAMDVEALEEDLWSMEDIPETAALPDEADLVEEQKTGESFGLDESFDTMEEPVSTEPLFNEQSIPEEISAASEPGVPLMREAEMPSKEELLGRFEAVVDRKVASVLAELDLKEALLSSLMPSLKDSVDKVLWEIAPELTEKVLREILSSSVSSLTREVEKVIWETVPDLANTLISREIEKIKSEF